MTTTRNKAPRQDTRLAEAERLERRAKTLRDRTERDFVAQFPKKGDRLLVRYNYFYDNTRDREGVVTQASPSSRTLRIEFDQWVTCDSCGHKKHKLSANIRYDQILERLPGPTKGATS